jgi:hypothetical protein
MIFAAAYGGFGGDGRFHGSYKNLETATKYTILRTFIDFSLTCLCKAIQFYYEHQAAAIFCY